MPSARLMYRNALGGLAAALIVAGLSACGGASQRTTVAGFSPAAAPRGASLTLAGSNLGTSPGTVTIGGVAAMVTSWSADSIEVTVPDGAGNGWQSVSVSAASATITLQEHLFVGVEYAGTDPELRQFLLDQPTGIAVLLQARAHDLTAETDAIVIDNIDVYGRGVGKTHLALPVSVRAGAVADAGAVTTIADIGIAGTLVLVQGPYTDGLFTTALSGVEALDSSTVGTFVLRGASITGPTGIHSVAPTADLYALELRDTTIDHGANPLMVSTLGGILLDNVTLRGSEIGLNTALNSLTITSSALRADSVGLLAGAGLTVSDSTLLATNGQLTLTGAMGGAPTSGPINVSSSTLGAFDADITDIDPRGSIQISALRASVTLQDNLVVKAHDSLIISTSASSAGEGDIYVEDNKSIEVGIFSADEPVNYRSGVVSLRTSATGPKDRVLFQGNAVSVNGVLSIRADDNADVVFSGNTGTLGDDTTSGDLDLYVAGNGSITMAGNTMALSHQIATFVADSGGRPLLVTDNEFRTTSGAEANTILRATGGPCELTSNKFVITEPTATHHVGFRLECYATGSGQALEMRGNTVTLSGHVASRVYILGNGLSSVDVAENNFAAGGAVSVHLSAPLVNIVDNELHSTIDGLIVQGEAPAGIGKLNVLRNHITFGEATGYALYLQDVRDAEIRGNIVTVTATPSPEATALRISSTIDSVVVATGNTFTNLRRALLIEGHAVNQPTMSVAVNDNVFDFDFWQAPQVAQLRAVKDAVNATNNVWGAVTSASEAESYVTLDPATLSLGGSVTLDPIRQP